ncbi:hypothetical protein DB346_17400 [Verrucomicrobia bacterium LW23]|nr:hypothetical protein DB346_17400 [Verrucomicrobia bacterium LW23]
MLFSRFLLFKCGKTIPHSRGSAFRCLLVGILAAAFVASDAAARLPSAEPAPPPSGNGKPSRQSSRLESDNDWNAETEQKPSPLPSRGARPAPAPAAAPTAPASAEAAKRPETESRPAANTSTSTKTASAEPSAKPAAEKPAAEEAPKLSATAATPPAKPLAEKPTEKRTASATRSGNASRRNASASGPQNRTAGRNKEEVRPAEIPRPIENPRPLDSDTRIIPLSEEPRQPAAPHFAALGTSKVGKLPHKHVAPPADPSRKEPGKTTIAEAILPTGAGMPKGIGETQRPGPLPPLRGHSAEAPTGSHSRTETATASATPSRKATAATPAPAPTVDNSAPIPMPPLTGNPATRVLAPLPLVPVPEPAYNVEMPELVDDVPPPTDRDPTMEPRQKHVLARNLQALRTMRMVDPAKMKQVCRAKIASAATPASLKLLYASMLTLTGDPSGRDFLRVSLTNVNGPQLADTMWMLQYLALESDTLKGGQRPDLAWAEDLLIAALKDKRNVQTSRIFPQPAGPRSAGPPLVAPMPATVQVRELAVMTGRFQEILSAARSRRLPGVLVDWAKESPPPSDLSPFLLTLGRYDYDTKAEALVLERVAAYGKDFGAAAAAAVSMELKDAVPHLMKHAADPRAQAALARLGDLRIVKDLKHLLPKLPRGQQPAMEMLIIRLSTHDPLPAMLDYVEDTKNPARAQALDYLDTVSDPRAIELAKFLMEHDPLPDARLAGIRCLVRIARTGNRDALQALMAGLSVPFDRLAQTPTEKALANASFRGEILESLRGLTRQGFGMDQQAWYAWFREGDAAIAAGTSTATEIAQSSTPGTPGQFGPPAPGAGHPESDPLPQGETLPMAGDEAVATYVAPDGTPGDDENLPTHDAPGPVEPPTPASLVPTRKDRFAPAWPLAFSPSGGEGGVDAFGLNESGTGPGGSGNAPHAGAGRDMPAWTMRLSVDGKDGESGTGKVQGPPVPEELTRPTTFMVASAQDMVSGPPTPGSFYARVFAKDNPYTQGGLASLVNGQGPAGGNATADGNGGADRPLVPSGSVPDIRIVASYTPAEDPDAWKGHASRNARRSLDAVLRPPRQLAAAFRDDEDSQKQGPPLPIPRPVPLPGQPGFAPLSVASAETKAAETPGMEPGPVPSLATLPKAPPPPAGGMDEAHPEAENASHGPVPSLGHLSKATTPYEPATDAPLPASRPTDVAHVEVAVDPLAQIMEAPPEPKPAAVDKAPEAPHPPAVAPAPAIASQSPVPAPAPGTVPTPEAVPDRQKMLDALAEAKAEAEKERIASTTPAQPSGPDGKPLQPNSIEAMLAADYSKAPEPNTQLADMLAEAGTPILAAPNRALLQRKAAETLALQQGPGGVRLPIGSGGTLLNIRDEYAVTETHTPEAAAPSPSRGELPRTDAVSLILAAFNLKQAPGPETASVPANAPSATMLADAGTPMISPSLRNLPRGDGNGGAPVVAGLPSRAGSSPSSRAATAEPAAAPGGLWKAGEGTTLTRMFTELVLKPHSDRPSASTPAMPSAAPGSPGPAVSAQTSPASAPAPAPVAVPTAAPLMQLLNDVGTPAPAAG